MVKKRRVPGGRYGALSGGAWTHPKVRGLSVSATALWYQGLSYAIGQGTDGKIHENQLKLLLPQLPPRKLAAAAEELVAARLWLRVSPMCFECYDYLSYQYSESQMKEHSDQAKRAIEKRWGHTDRITDRYPTRQDKRREEASELGLRTVNGNGEPLSPEALKLYQTTGRLPEKEVKL